MKRTIGALLTITAMAISSGCQGPGLFQRPDQQTQASAGASGGQNFVNNPSNPSQAWAVAPNGQHIPVQLAADGSWGTPAKSEPTEKKKPQFSYLTNSAPNRYTPMVDFLEDHGLTLEDYGTVAKTYQASSVEDGRTKVKAAFMDSLKDFVGNQQIAGYEAATKHARELRKALGEVRVD